ncbi:3-oxoacyl-(acyl-carrier-protein) synthase [Owenweeksia hongkongensis DSM 17368]|uniref:3-oxoacyl-(Acyl-carrier-protein) synthase n=1 Tax=Owenweeksia hongkongensis (strain DSM 17368 / CIP 108786 / JCM 12287 / NRRL B-23963 / UST20020801) TaxID=926562 RepID=G8R629_OWEHD|nr:beta-ketoacyl-[acyl-carrier-protein] synthase family protein [Owenweeksia hongkongensis]AEV32219.1 3-oxoacyl-(acyl-carrier-protein) synthase [Owenweeksia hongkongensis DSM 17368]
MNRVVITGIGIHSCLGTDVNEVTESLHAGKSGIVFDQERKDFGFRSALTGAVPMPDLKGKLGRRDRIGLSEEAIYAYVATLQALEQAKMDEEFISKNEVGILYGNDSSAKAVMEAIDLIREKKDTTLLGSGSIFQSMNCTVSMNLSTIFKLKGINFTISAACASGSHAIGLGYHMIRSGMQEQIVCGGAQEVNMYAFGSFDGLGAFSIREDDPTKASRPFDKDRDGLIPSGGAATVILESYESAVKRGAPILGEIVGYGFSSNGEHISNPNLDGQVRALNMALKQQDTPVEDIKYINAHATSTGIGDKFEAQALHEVFHSTRPYVSSTKSMTGHECWMAGASEIVYSLLMMNNDFIAPNINFANPDEDSAKLNIATKTIEQKFDCFLSNSFGFGGTNSSLIIKKYKP